jgi:hypothetical protein
VPRVRPPLGAGNPPEDATTIDEQPVQQDAPTAPAPTLSEPKPIPTTPPDLAPLWSKVIRAEGISPLLRAVLINSSLISFNSGKATIHCLPRYAKDASTRWRMNIAELIAKESSSTTPVEIIITGAENSPASTAPSPHSSSPHSSPPQPDSPQPRAEPAPQPTTINPSTHPLVQTALELFGGRIVDIQPRKR